MKAKVIEGRGTTDMVVRVGQLIGFIKSTEKLPVGTEVDIVITGIKVHPETKRAIVFCRLVEKDDVLIYHEGFECTGPGGRTLAQPTDKEEFKFQLTPRMSGVYVAQNSPKNRADWETNPEALRPGLVFIKASNVFETDCVRIEGLDSLDDLDYVVRNPELFRPVEKTKHSKQDKSKKQKKKHERPADAKPASNDQLSALVAKFKH